MPQPSLVDDIAALCNVPREQALARLPTVLGPVFRSWDSVATAALPFHVYFPEAFRTPALRAVLHLALDADVLRPDQLYRVVQPLLATEERFGDLLHHQERLSLGARLRLAILCRRVAGAVSSFGPDLLLRGERERVFDEAILTLLRDRDTAVASNAAWAAGLRAGDSPAIDRALAAHEAEGAPPYLRRRALVSAFARALDGQGGSLDAARASSLCAKSRRRARASGARSRSRRCRTPRSSWCSI